MDFDKTSTEKTFVLYFELSPALTAFFKFFEKHDLASFMKWIETVTFEFIFQFFRDLELSGRRDIANKWRSYFLEKDPVSVLASRVDDKENLIELIVSSEVYTCISALKDADKEIFKDLVNMVPYVLAFGILTGLNEFGRPDLFEKWNSYLLENDEIYRDVSKTAFEEEIGN